MLNDLEYCSIPDGTCDGAITDNVRKGCADYTVRGIYPFKRYIRLSKFYNKFSYKWLETGSYYPVASSFLKVNGKGYAVGDKMGQVVVTYYC